MIPHGPRPATLFQGLRPWFHRRGVGDYIFEWDPDKAASNVEKHGVTFEEATHVFVDNQTIKAATTTNTARWARIAGLQLEGPAR
jgi:hypothetical protein